MSQAMDFCIDSFSSSSSRGDKPLPPKTTPLNSNWIARNINEEMFRMQIELDKMKLYVAKMNSLGHSKEDEETLALRASKLLDTWKDYMYTVLYDVYKVYVDDMTRTGVGDKGLMMGYINVSLKKYLSKASFKVYKGSVLDLQVLGVCLEVDPIEDIELVLDPEHPMQIEYKRDLDMVRVGGQGGDTTPRHPFYKEHLARRGEVGEGEENVKIMNLSPGEVLKKRGDIFEPLCIPLPKIYWVNKIDWELWGYLIHTKRIKVYKEY